MTSALDVPPAAVTAPVRASVVSPPGAGLHLVEAGARVDRLAAQQAVSDLLSALGQDVDAEHLTETPRRVAAAFAEMLQAPHVALTTFPDSDGYDGLVMVRDIPFTSLCAHHLLAFHGVARVGYLPGERLVGLSKVARIVEMYARRLQIQEALTQQIADCLQEHLSPRGVGVVLEAEHLCMSLRGARAAGARTVTTSLHGLVRDDARTREEFLALSRRADR